MTVPVLFINLKAALVRPPERSENLLRRPRDVLLLGLLCFDFLISLGMSLSIKWLSDQSVRCSPLCTAQGFISTIGETGSAMLIIAITIYTILTFVVSRENNRRPTWIPLAVIAAVTVYLILLVSIEEAKHHNTYADASVQDYPVDDFLVPSPFWCWIGSRFKRSKIGVEYMWLWLAAVSSFFYIPMGLYMKHNDMTHDKFYFKILLYPIAFTILVLPISIVRWLAFTGHSVTDTATWAASLPYYFMPLVNVLLLRYVRGRVNLVNPSLGTIKEESNSSLELGQRGHEGGLPQ